MIDLVNIEAVNKIRIPELPEPRSSTYKGREWTYGIVTSGGGGHMAAGLALQKIEEAEGKKMVMMDLMRCSASWHERFGKFCTDKWDRAQNAGDIAEQARIVQKQYLADKLFFLPTFIKVVMDLLLAEKLPSKIIVTQPLALPAILCAVRFVNFFSENKIEKLDLYMTDFPKEQSTHFFGALSRVAQDYPELSRMITLHAPSPSQEDLNRFGGDLEAFWKFHTGINALDVMIADIPINQDYRSLNLPKPGEDCTLGIKAQVPAEAAFLRVKMGQTKSYDIGAKDRVGLVMLGSQPTHSAIKNYVQSFINMAKIVKAEKKVKDSTTYLFVACGPAAKNKDYGLYQDIVELVQEHRSLLRETRLVIVPFTGQPAAHLNGRADLFRLTRSGGLSTAELLALAERREDTAKSFIHTQTPFNLAHKAHQKMAEMLIKEDISLSHFNRWISERKENYFEEALQQARNEFGNPLWEAGNALYLQEALGQDKVGFIGPEDSQRELMRTCFPDITPPSPRFAYDSGLLEKFYAQRIEADIDFLDTSFYLDNSLWTD